MEIETVSKCEKDTVAEGEKVSQMQFTVSIFSLILSCLNVELKNSILATWRDHKFLAWLNNLFLVYIIETT